MNMFDAIYSRKSIHHFIQEKLEWDAIADILEFANNMPMLFNGIAVEYKLVSNIEAKQGFRGLFSVKAPYYICISSEKKDDYLLNAGYLLQQLNLYITSKGFGACVIETTNPGRSLKSTMKYEYTAALAFGKTSEQLYRAGSEAKRLPEADVIVYKEDVNSDMKKLLTAARLAPSSYNSQPWRFVVYKNRIHIFTKKSTLMSKLLDNNKMIDMGAMLANLLLAAEELWLETSIIKSDVIMNKQFQNNAYVCTITIG